MVTSFSRVAPSTDPSQGAAHFRLASSARVLGRMHLGPGVHVAQGAVVCSPEGAVQLGAGSAVRENAVVIGTARHPVAVGEKTALGPRSLMLGASAGHLCDVGAGAILMPGAQLGDRCLVADGTLVPAGMFVPSDSVVVGRPARVVRRVDTGDLERLRTARGGTLSLPEQPLTPFFARDRAEDAPMGQLYSFRDKHPLVHPTATLFSSCEVTGDVLIGPGAIIGPGVRIVGESHVPLRIGAGVRIHANAVVHLQPGGSLVIEDGVFIGPGCLVHACFVGAGTVVEPGAILCDRSRLGRGCIVGAGSLVRAGTLFPDAAQVDGFPAVQTGFLSALPPAPVWALRPEDLPELRRVS
ncbi:UDP-3-O-(3-hydroxymyristoyl) glucosamine N-acyltransferase [Myxococcus sp. CA051A]|uniref:UDP-3-O-(3-hydroxymyristoyl) glucosamine N-acyltransferase n=2 Tax=Myxococcaceae TaxID=31 RepID=A0A540WV10_9BACT|nr:UDP-3-O-(3-hydroxymyristoyl) glucosamine N-acyltransferase [Myxococcus sp. CA056]NTX60217.1 UDP-3-O-(3-hydroxymyristoyl) glucosamine N-acyltransferase [Myxococcus sp. CA051A]TQF12826.1 UDP-3-O-(3-hydroxymyristoyl) glucosamine N-acyltransferase [Myxococcus llanfairpwllgwyngyllgogerychwyrndrobwllllantysiliogogogochensis]